MSGAKASRLKAWRPAPAHIAAVAAVAEAFHLTVEDLCGDDRAQRVASVRQVAYWVLKTRFGLPWKAVAACLDRSDHGTPIYGVKRVERRREADSTFRRKTDTLARGERTRHPDFSAIAAKVPDRPNGNGSLRVSEEAWAFLAQRKVKQRDSVCKHDLADDSAGMLWMVEQVASTMQLGKAVATLGRWPDGSRAAAQAVPA